MLIECPTCRRRMDAVAANCPGCGKALVRKSTRLRRPLMLDVAVFVGMGSAVAWFIWWLVTGPSF